MKFYVGKRFDYATVIGIKLSEKTRYYKMILIKCDCGTIRYLSETCFNKTRVSPISCGCKRIIKKTHGLKKHPLYNLWSSMRSRCKNKNAQAYKNYGGRGISVCKEWDLDFIKYYEWCLDNGWAKGLQIDRIDNNGDYRPDNCRIVTTKKNCRNTRDNHNISYMGQTRCISEWAEIFNIPAPRLSQRIIRDKMTFEDAISRPPRKIIKK